MVMIDVRWKDGVVTRLEVTAAPPIKLMAERYADPENRIPAQGPTLFYRVEPLVDGSHPTIYEEA